MDAVAIVGGGIAGLALAARLDPQRFQVTIHERRDEPAPAETSLAVWPEAQRALEALGLLAAVRAAGSPAGGMALRTGPGETLLRRGAAGAGGVSRADLHRLLESAVPGSAAWAHGAVREVPEADVVVGADGVHSSIRRAVWGERYRARLSPYLALRGITDQSVPPGAGGEYWGRGQLFGIMPASRSRTYWYASYRSDEGPETVDVGDALDRARARFSGQAAAIGRVLTAAAPDRTLAQRIWTAPPLRGYALGSVVLVGDAAHGMTPNLGRGACEALVDAVTLADLLNSRPSGDALRAYNRRRLLRTQALRGASAAVTRVALADRGVPLRNGLLRLAGRAVRGAAAAGRE